LPALNELLDKRWASLLDSSFDVLQKLDREIDFNNCVPRKEAIFRAFECDPHEVSVVIFGQDPYPNADHAMGLSFSVDENVSKLPASLKNIFREMRDDIGDQPISGDLSFLSKQGVMLLNRGLTIDLKTKNVHPLWFDFTNDVAEILGTLDVIGVFWGSKAQELAHFFPENKRIIGVHPSPLSAYKGFFGSKPFSQVNKILKEANKKSIVWTKQ
jgi:uracil-DNA glycosylase